MARLVGAEPVALVTGSASGIGLATIGRATQAGYVPVGLDSAAGRPDEGSVAAAGGRIFHADVTDSSTVAAAVDEIERTIGPIAVAVGAAGVLVERPFASVDEDLWNRTLEVHLLGTYNLTVAALPGMVTRGSGSIVTIASELATVGAADHVHYVAAKAAVMGFTRAAARELAHHGIRVNGVAPGPTDTPLLGESGRDPSYVQTIPLGRVGTPEEIAQAIIDVARWSWSTGQIYGVNGGAVIR